MTQKLQVGQLGWDSSNELNEHIFTTLHIKDLVELGKFMDSYKDPLNAQIESLKHFL
jgi:hypothetical protein